MRDFFYQAVLLAAGPPDCFSQAVFRQAVKRTSETHGLERVRLTDWLYSGLVTMGGTAAAVTQSFLSRLRPSSRLYSLIFSFWVYRYIVFLFFNCLFLLLLLSVTYIPVYRSVSMFAAFCFSCYPVFALYRAMPRQRWRAPGHETTFRTKAVI